MLGEVSCEASAVGAGALDADPDQFAVATHPGQQSAVSGPGRGEAAGAQHGAGCVHDRGDVDVLVGVHAGEYWRA